MKPRPASVAITKHAATISSARFALAGSSGSAGSSRRRGGGGPPGVPGAGVWSMDLASAGGGVPMTRRRGSVGSPLAVPWPSRPSSGSPAGSWPPECPAVESLMSLPVLRSDPQCREHHEEQQPEEGHQPLGDGPDPAEAESARVRLGTSPKDISNDVPLLLRRDRRVVERRHGLRARQHGLVDLPRRRTGERRRVLSLSQGAAGADEVMALRAGGNEQLL